MENKNISIPLLTIIIIIIAITCGAIGWLLAKQSDVQKNQAAIIRPEASRVSDGKNNDIDNNMIVADDVNSAALTHSNGDRLMDNDIQVKNINLSESDNVTQIINEIVDASEWKVYKNTRYGFEIGVPQNWKFYEHKKNNYGEIVSLIQSNDDRSISPGINIEDESVLIQFFGDINDEVHMQGYSKKVNGLKEFLNLDKSTTEMSVIDEMQFKGQDAYLVSIMGYAGKYGIIFENQDGVYLISFPDFKNIIDLNVISTFNFL